MPAWLLVSTLLGVSLPLAELVFIQSRGAEACDETMLRQSVATRLGYDPFVANADVRVVVRLGGDRALTAQVDVLRPGVAPAERTLTGPGDCKSLTEALALALALAIDPLMLSRTPRAVEPDTPAAPVTPGAPRSVAPGVPVAAEPFPPASPRAAAEVGARPRAERLNLEVDLAGALGFNAQPGTAVGVRLGAQTGRGLWLVRLEGWTLFPSSTPIAGGGAVEGFSAGADAGPCVRVEIISACLLARGGTFRYQGKGLDLVRQGWLSTFAAGARAGAEWPRKAAVAAFAAVEAWVPVTNLTLLVGESIAWDQGAVEGGGVVGVRLRAF